MRFNTDYRLIDNAISDFSSAAKAMEGYAGRLGKVKSAVDIMGISSSISDSIGSRATIADTIAARAISVKICFEKIKVIYLNGEQEVHRKMSENRFLASGKTITTGGVIRVAGGAAQSKWKVPWRGIITAGVIVGKVVKPVSWPKIAWDRFKNLWENLKEKMKKQPSGITKEQEAAADLRMKNEIQSLLSKYENAWRRATTDAEKMKLLNDFLAEIQRVMGTSAKAKINFRSLNAPEGYISYGSYTPFTKRITLNKNLLSEPGGIYLFTVLIHEARHAYQHEAAKSNKHTVSDETRQIWKDNLKRKNYKTSERDGYDAYRNQPVERDARWFAGERG